MIFKQNYVSLSEDESYYFCIYCFGLASKEKPSSVFADSELYEHASDYTEHFVNLLSKFDVSFSFSIMGLNGALICLVRSLSQSTVANQG